jgi:predicted ester cyclase
MSTEQNKAIVRRMFEVNEQGKLDDIDRITAHNWVNHDPSLPPMQGLEGARQLAGLFHGAFRDARVTIEEMIAEGDKVATRFSFSGTHKGNFMNLAPTGKKISVTSTGIFQVVGGKLTDNWVNFDALGLMQQLGVVPPPPGQGK